jgi:metal-dependent amidase/aminoacylase/carboxypeptidase family protein
MMVHPRGKDSPAGLRNLAAVSLYVEFWGKSAHAAAAPWDSINALEALILAINNINALRFHLRDRSRVAGVITDGGKYPNVVPEHSAATFMIRAFDNNVLAELREKVLNCFKGAALSTGTRLDYRWGMESSCMRHNSVLIQLWTDNMKSLGRRVEGILDSLASTDMGNVSVIVPSLHPFIAISSTELPIHSREFAAAAASDAAMEALVDGAKALAMTAADVIIRPETLSRINKEFMNSSRHSWC